MNEQLEKAYAEQNSDFLKCIADRIDESVGQSEQIANELKRIADALEKISSAVRDNGYSDGGANLQVEAATYPQT